MILFFNAPLSLNGRQGEGGRFRKWFEDSGSGSCDVVSVIINGDPFSRLSLGHVKDVVRSCKFIAGKGGAAEDVEWRELR